MNFDIKTKIKSIKSFKDNRHLIIAFALLICISIYISHANKPVDNNQENTVIQADTIIPKGFILYPIQLQNIEAIKGLIDQYGVIDVYGSNGNGKNKKLLSKVKIMQAPYNPNEYALLLPEYKSQKMMLESGPFSGVIQNRSVKSDLTEQDTTQKTKKINIEYQTGA